MDINFYGDYNIVSTYVYRGVKQQNGPAIQSTFSISYNDYTIGLWSSSINFGNDVEVETDAFIYYSSKIRNVSFDLGLTIYSYDFFEVYNSDSKIEMESFIEFKYKSFDLRFNYIPSQHSTKNDILDSFYWVEFGYEKEILGFTFLSNLSFGTYSSRFLQMPCNNPIEFFNISISKDIGSGFLINWNFCKSIGKKTEDIFYFGVGYSF